MRQNGINKHRPMVGITRLFAYKEGVTRVEDIPKEEAKSTRNHLEKEGWVVWHSETL